MNTRKLALAGIALSVACYAAFVRADDKDEPLMKRKMTAAHQALEGLATNQFDKLAAAGDNLSELSRSKDWRVLRTVTYEMYSAEFQRAAERMARQARAKNTDGAALAYVDLTLTCVKCHQHVRETRNARLDGEAAGGLGR